MLKRYCLKIPFELNGNSSIKSENDNIAFDWMNMKLNFV